VSKVFIATRNQRKAHILPLTVDTSICIFSVILLTIVVIMWEKSDPFSQYVTPIISRIGISDKIVSETESGKHMLQTWQSVVRGGLSIILISHAALVCLTAVFHAQTLAICVLFCGLCFGFSIIHIPVLFINFQDMVAFDASMNDTLPGFIVDFLEPKVKQAFMGISIASIANWNLFWLQGLLGGCVSASVLFWITSTRYAVKRSMFIIIGVVIPVAIVVPLTSLICIIFLYQTFGVDVLWISVWVLWWTSSIVMLAIIHISFISRPSTTETDHRTANSTRTWLALLFYVFVHTLVLSYAAYRENDITTTDVTFAIGVWLLPMASVMPLLLILFVKRSTWQDNAQFTRSNNQLNNQSSHRQHQQLKLRARNKQLHTIIQLKFIHELIIKKVMEMSWKTMTTKKKIMMAKGHCCSRLIRRNRTRRQLLIPENIQITVARQPKAIIALMYNYRTRYAHHRQLRQQQQLQLQQARYSACGNLINERTSLLHSAGSRNQSQSGELFYESFSTIESTVSPTRSELIQNQAQPAAQVDVHQSINILTDSESAEWQNQKQHNDDKGSHGLCTLDRRDALFVVGGFSMTVCLFMTLSDYTHNSIVDYIMHILKEGNATLQWPKNGTAFDAAINLYERSRWHQLFSSFVSLGFLALAVTFCFLRVRYALAVSKVFGYLSIIALFSGLIIISSPNYLDSMHVENYLPNCTEQCNRAFTQSVKTSIGLVCAMIFTGKVSIVAFTFPPAVARATALLFTKWQTSREREALLVMWLGAPFYCVIITIIPMIFIMQTIGNSTFLVIIACFWLGPLTVTIAVLAINAKYPLKSFFVVMFAVLAWSALYFSSAIALVLYAVDLYGLWDAFVEMLWDIDFWALIIAEFAISLAVPADFIDSCITVCSENDKTLPDDLITI
jgi:hypothetical protein